MKNWFIRILAAACLTGSATGALAQLPRLVDTDDRSTIGSGQQMPIRQPAGGGGGGQVPTVMITGPASGATIAIDTPVSFTGTFTDNAGDTHTAQWSFDVTTVAGVVNESGGTVSATMSFSTPGVYAVSLTVTDQGGNSDTATTVNGQNAVVVIFAHEAGFANGSGRIISPPGALVADPQATGRADFSFNSRYHKLETTPRGSTYFKLQAGDFEFLSTHYDWIIARPNGALFSGSGTVNGDGDFAFLLSAVDGDDFNPIVADKFRIQIKDKATGAVVYDNQMGAPDTAMATFPIDWGSVNVRLPNGGLGHLSAILPRVEPASQAMARGFALSQNWPNPFRAKTEVRFSLPQRSNVKLGVYDVAGREVASLSDGPWDAGSHTVSWSGRTASGSTARGGVYFVRMAVGTSGGGAGFVAVRKMTVLD